MNLITSSLLLALTLSGAAIASAFLSPTIPTSLLTHSNAGTPRPAPSSASSSTALHILISEYATREVYAMEAWAANYGMQKAPGVEISSTDNGDGRDYELVASSALPAGSTVLYVPSSLVIRSDAVADEFGGYLAEAEETLVQLDKGTAQRLPLFRLVLKILAEYEKFEDSPYSPWLDSLPRTFYNGVAMTDACFACLPPYAAMLARNERNTYSRFLNAIRMGYVPLSEETIANDQIIKWAYNVALTRFHEIWEPSHQKLIIPMVDMLNHASEANCKITVDQQGDVYVNTLWDVPAGYPLTISLGDPTNPTALFAKHGLLPTDCATIFCKAVHLEPQIKALGYDFAELLFNVQTGEVSPKVWDIFLLELLQNNDPGSAEEFYAACKVDDENTKQQYHSYYFAYTLDALKRHVYSILGDVTELTMKANAYDLTNHPRVPVIVQHNNLVLDTFTMTASALEQMG